MNGDDDDIQEWAVWDQGDERGEDPAVAEAQRELSEFFRRRPEETFYAQQLAVIFERQGSVHLTSLERRRAGDQAETRELPDGFFHWITIKALRRLEEEGQIESSLEPLGVVEPGRQGASVRFYRNRNHRYWKRQRNEMLRLMREYSALSLAIGRHGETSGDTSKPATRGRVKAGHHGGPRPV